VWLHPPSVWSSDIWGAYRDLFFLAHPFFVACSNRPLLLPVFDREALSPPRTAHDSDLLPVPDTRPLPLSPPPFPPPCIFCFRSPPSVKESLFFLRSLSQNCPLQTKYVPLSPLQNFRCPLFFPVYAFLTFRISSFFL